MALLTLKKLPLINNEVICKNDLLGACMINVCNSLCNKYAAELTSEQTMSKPGM